MTLLEMYKNYHDDIENRIDSFSDLNAKRLRKKLKNETDRNNFLSTVSEMRFGEVFNSLRIECEYDKKFSNGQTPDWVLIFESTQAICDVYRLGKSRIDKIRSDLENALIERMEKINAPYCVRINFIQEYFEEGIYDPDSISSLLENWLISNHLTVGEKITIFENFEFEIFYLKAKSCNVTVLGNASSIDIKPNKIKQTNDSRPNEITKKLTKYNDLIYSYNCPYFLCVDIDFVSGFNHSDFVEHFRGSGVTFVDYGTSYGEMEQFQHLGMEWTELGEFYKNPQLSGIITCYNQEFVLLLNPQSSQHIYKAENQELLSKLKALTKSE